MSRPIFEVDENNPDFRADMLRAYDFNITWYERAGNRQRALHFILGVGIILIQIATLTSFAFEKVLPSGTSPALSGLTSALIALFGFLSPTAKWRDFRSAQFELMAQRLLFRVDMSGAPDAAARRAVVAKYVELGMRVISSTASSYWRQVSKAVERLAAGDHSDHPGGH